jgi:hypothetical protein
METVETNVKSFWNKLPAEMTVGDQVKLGIGVTVACTVAPLLIVAGLGAASSLAEKFKNRDRKSKVEIVKIAKAN